MGDLLTRAYRDGVLDTEGFPLADVSEQLERPGTFVWIDLCSPSSDQLHELADELGLHELAVEDALGSRQRPKLDHYESHVFLSSRAITVDVDGGRLGEAEVDAFMDARWIITVRESDLFPIGPVAKRCDNSSELAVNGPSFVMYVLLDVLVDDYFEAIESLDEFYDGLSDRIFGEHPLDLTQQRDWFEMRRVVSRFHRLVVATREAVSGLLRRERQVVAAPLRPYFQDVYDHLVRVSDSADSLRDLVGTLAETNLSLRDYRQNLIVKKVGSWAAIITVPAVITGYFGMNVPFPGSGEVGGVILASVLMVVSSVTLYFVFHSRDWL
ncbi:MAG TPA: magnesium transporter CorA family protein [Acidimicrobiia bacterium]|nr:magnesium transporter CorA family protein [Acidimicrobiia bacterium]